MYPIVTEICEKMVKYVDEKIESGENTFISKEASIISFIRIQKHAWTRLW